MEEDANVVFELSCLASNIKEEVVAILSYFLSFLKNYEKKNPIDMLFFILDCRF